MDIPGDRMSNFPLVSEIGRICSRRSVVRSFGQTTILIYVNAFTEVLKMKSLLVLIIPVLLCGQTVEEPLTLSSSDAELRVAMLSPTSQPQGSPLPVSDHFRRRGLGLVMSAAVPGVGQFYSASVLKGALMIGAEVALWVGYGHYRQEGDRLDRDFRAFADENWSEIRYWLALAGDGARAGWTELEGLTEDNYQEKLDVEGGLREYEKTIGSHSLHRYKDQQYYEMIGKYHQFRPGWKDAETSNEVVTPLRGRYEDMEFETDSAYKKAGVCGMVILANHVISALDAVLSVNRYNARIRMKPGMGLIETHGSVTPVFSMNLTWTTL
jgi:hypothetical protein